LNVLQISANDTHEIRSVVLADEFSNNYSYHNDDRDQTFHLGAFDDNKLVSVASFFFEKIDNFEDEYQYQLRGMATLPKHRHKGFSSELLQMAFSIIKQNQCTILWCNARESARGYYEKVGFMVIDGPYENDQIGNYYLMSKSI